jgi:hypothetical protein
MACTSRPRPSRNDQGPAERRRSHRRAAPSRTTDLPLAVWPCAQRSAQVQRQGRFAPASNQHPAKMLPEIARRAISAYSDRGDVVLDPMCGIATTLVEASHLDRGSIGVELEPRWAALAAENIQRARAQGAAAEARVLQGDARRLGHGVLDDLAGQVPLILTSPPYGNSQLGDSRAGSGMARCRACEGRRVTAADRVMASQLARSTRYGDSAGSVAALRYGSTDESLTPPPREGRPISRLWPRSTAPAPGCSSPAATSCSSRRTSARTARCGTSPETRSRSASESVCCSSSTSSRCSWPSAITSCSRAPPTSS